MAATTSLSIGTMTRPKCERPGESRGDLPLEGIPDQHAAIDQRHVQTQCSDHALEHFLVEPAEHHALEDQGAECDDCRAERDCQQPRQLELSIEIVEREATEHGELAVREVDHAHDAEQQREAERDQDIDAAERQTIDDHLTEHDRIGHHFELELQGLEHGDTGTDLCVQA